MRDYTNARNCRCHTKDTRNIYNWIGEEKVDTMTMAKVIGITDKKLLISAEMAVVLILFDDTVPSYEHSTGSKRIQNCSLQKQVFDFES